MGARAGPSQAIHSHCARQASELRPVEVLRRYHRCVLPSFALLALVGGGGPQLPAPPPAAPDEAVTLTKRLFSAVRARNADDFAAVTGLPFTYGTTDHPKGRQCNGTAKNESQRKQMFDCVLKDEEILVHDLSEFTEDYDFVDPASSETVVRRFDPKSRYPSLHTSKALARRAAILRRSGVSLFMGDVPGSGVIYWFVIAIRGTGNEARVVGLVLDHVFYD